MVAVLVESRVHCTMKDFNASAIIVFTWGGKDNFESNNACCLMSIDWH